MIVFQALEKPSRSGICQELTCYLKTGRRCGQKSHVKAYVLNWDTGSIYIKMSLSRHCSISSSEVTTIIAEKQIRFVDIGCLSGGATQMGKKHRQIALALLSYITT